MNFELSDEQRLLAEQARRLFEDLSPPDRLRQLLSVGVAWDEPLWRAMADLGFLGCSTPEAYGGLGLSNLDTAMIVNELGRTVAAVPFLSSVILAADAILRCGSEIQKQRWLPAISAGDAVVAFAYAEGTDDAWSALPSATLAEGRLTGVKWPVADLAIAHAAVVVCQSAGRMALAIVELDQSGVAVTPLDGIDQVRSHGELRLDGVAADRLEGDVIAILPRLLDRAAALTAFEQIGGAEACLAMALDHVKQREIFGRRLASYQAVKHTMADIYVAIELARSNAYFAAWACENDPAAAPAAAACARLSACEAYQLAARESLQLHGGIGYTWEANCHFHLRRERLLRSALGGISRWADRLIAAVAPAAALSWAA